jgi:hypothetical protein
MDQTSDEGQRGGPVGAATLSSLRSSIGRLVVNYGAVAVAIVSAVLYYISYIAETTYLGEFGLHPSMFGSGRPDIAAIIIPVVIFMSIALSGLYHGVTSDKDPPMWMQRLIISSLAGDPKKAVYRVSFWTALVIFVMSFAMIYNMSSRHGLMKAALVRYQFDKLACFRGCLAFHLRSSSTTKAGTRSPDIIGVPVQRGNGLYAIYTGAKVTIVKVDEIETLTPVRLVNAKGVTHFAPYDLILQTPLF